MPADSRLIAVARGDEPADLVLNDVRLINVFTREVLDNVAIAFVDGVIAQVGAPLEARETLDLRGKYVAPGFIDAHMHVESTMMKPSEFMRVALPHGTTGVVLDPHEIANVAGIDGIRYLMDDARDLPMRIMFAASSCVPASHLETSGATLRAADLEPLFDDERIVALAEMMNFPGVVHADPDILDKIALGLRERIVDGHCPGLTGSALNAYVAAGISSDHEATTADEAREKLRLGMRLYLREGSAAKNLEALLPIVTPENAHRCCFCTDDRHPGDLRDEGHIDHVIRRAVELGLDPVLAISMASIHVADHYRLPELGALAPGRRADCVVFDDIRAPRPELVYVDGELVARDGTYCGPTTFARPDPDDTGLRMSVRLPAEFDAASLRIAARPDAESIHVIGMNPTSLVTDHLHQPPKIDDDQYVADVDRDVLKLAVIERHHGTGNIGLGFVHGFGLTRGALASTVGHDSHNLIVVGTNDEDMALAARTLSELGGGQIATADGEVCAVLPLPLAGLLSDMQASELVEAQRALLSKVRELGCAIHDPYMPLSFLPLSVIPTLKLSDQGLVDVAKFKIIALD